MLRALLVLLVLANALFFAWSRDWLAPMWPAPRHADREPGRIGAQVKPELIVVLPVSQAGSAATAALRTAVACIEAGPYAEAEIAGAEAALAAADLPRGSWVRTQAQVPATWMLFAGRFPDAAARQARAAELTRLGLPHELIQGPPELAPGFVISRHASRDAAELALAAIGDKPLADVRVVAVPAQLPQHWLRAPAADAELQARLFALDRGFKPCAPRP
jgi:hypothetical protein